MGHIEREPESCIRDFLSKFPGKLTLILNRLGKRISGAPTLLKPAAETSCYECEVLLIGTTDETQSEYKDRLNAFTHRGVSVVAVTFF